MHNDDHIQLAETDIKEAQLFLELLYSLSYAHLNFQIIYSHVWGRYIFQALGYRQTTLSPSNYYHADDDDTVGVTKHEYTIY